MAGTLTRLAMFGSLSRNAGEGKIYAVLAYLPSACGVMSG
jgi:hypothetical protein